MKHITAILAVVALAATFAPPTNAKPVASPDPASCIQDLASPAHTPDSDIGLQMQMVCLAPDLDQAAHQLAILTDCSTGDSPVSFAIIRPDDAPQAPQPVLIASLTRREASQLRRADWLHIDRVADPTAA
jgi:hypothetical protein